MKERPILFSAPMIRAILDGRKTQTRRVAKDFEEAELSHCNTVKYAKLKGKKITWYEAVESCPYGQPGDRLWVRETYNFYNAYSNLKGHITYKEDDPEAPVRWRSSIHMPRWASRILLEITDVRVERLQEISDKDAIAEGIEPIRIGSFKTFKDYGLKAGELAPRMSFNSLWNTLNKPENPEGWNTNPWVWVISFKKVEP